MGADNQAERVIERMERKPIARAARAVWITRAGAMTKADARILARAALEAIAEPTDEMIEAGIAKYMTIETGVGITRKELREIWRAMHDTILERE